MNKKTVAVVFGGVSSEHDISCISASAVIDNFPIEDYDLVLIGITKVGEWYLYSGDTKKIASGEWVDDESNRSAFISPDRAVHGIVLPEYNETIYIDAVFPVLHGKNGEDGTVQGLLTLAGIPFVGCGTASSAVCMDKIFQKTVTAQCGIGQARFVGFDIREFKADEAGVLDKIESLGYPCFIKPANAGSSVGISKAHDRESLKAAINDAAKIDRRIIAEEFIDGQEVECAVFGVDDVIASICGEILPAAEFYDFSAKYEADSGLLIPANITKEKTDEVRETAKKVYRALDCSGMTRIDFFVRKSDGKVLLNEPNTIPGFTSISMYPKLMNEMGYPFKKLVKALIDDALKKEEE